MTVDKSRGGIKNEKFFFSWKCPDPESKPRPLGVRLCSPRYWKLFIYAKSYIKEKAQVHVFLLKTILPVRLSIFAELRDMQWLYAVDIHEIKLDAKRSCIEIPD